MAYKINTFLASDSQYFKRFPTGFRIQKIMLNSPFSSNTPLPTKQSINLVIPVIVMIKIERIIPFGSELSELSNLFLKYRNLKNASFSKAAKTRNQSVSS